MPDMIAQRELYYDGRTVLPGERFEVQPHHVRLYERVKKTAVLAPEREPDPEPTPQPVRGRRAVLPPDPEPVIEPPPAAEPEAPVELPLPRGRYGRRDMRPADETGDV